MNYKKTFKYLLVVIPMFLLGYGLFGYGSAALDSEKLQRRAQTLISERKGAYALGPNRLELLLNVEDPGFFSHSGVDFNSKGAGATTLTQSLAKRLAFNKFRPGIGKIKQTTYAMSLEQRLTKNEILALFFESVPMGRGPDGWTTGFFNASHAFYGGPPSKISDNEYIELISVMIAPSRLNYITRNEEFESRLLRITRLNNGECEPLSHRDVWLEGCKI